MPKYERKFSGDKKKEEEEKRLEEEISSKLVGKVFETIAEKDKLFSLAVQTMMKKLVETSDSKNQKLIEVIGLLQKEIISLAKKEQIKIPTPEKFPEKIKISNLSEIKPQKLPEFPTSLEVKEPSWLSRLLMGFNLPDIFKVDLDKYKDNRHSLAVKVSDNQLNDLKKLIEKVIASNKKGQNYAFNMTEMQLLNSAGSVISPAEKGDIEAVNLNNQSNRFQYVSTAPTTIGKYYMGGRLSSSADLVLFANTVGKKVIVNGVSFTNSYIAEKEVDLHFGASGDNQGDVWYHNLAKDGGGNGFNMVNLPIEGVDDKGLYLDNGTGSYLYYSIWFEVVNT